MKDRVALYPGRVKLTPVAGQSNVYDMVRADQPTQEGTPLNKASLLTDETAALYGLGESAMPDDVFGALASHASRHAAGGSDPITPDMIGVVALASGTTIAANTDLDTLTTCGNYKCTSSTTVATLGNCPTTIAFVMQVGSSAPGVTNYFYQEIRTIQNKRYYRSSRNSSGSVAWNDWVEFLNTAGGTMSGNLSISKASPAIALNDTTVGNKAQIFAGNNRVYMQVANAEDGDNNRRQLILVNADAQVQKKAVVLNDVVDGVSSVYTILHSGNLDALGVARIETGSYKGTGTYGEENPTIINTGFTPKAILFAPPNSLSLHGAYEYAFRDEVPVLLVAGQTSVELGGNGTYDLNVEWGTTSISFWCDNSAYGQYNISWTTYRYVVFG